MKTDCRDWRLFVAALLVLLGCVSARANVYATNIKLNGSTNNAAIVPAGAVQISYILNEPATAGLSVEVCSNSAVLWTTNLAGGTAGAAAGSNSVVWASDTNVAAGIYQISITAAAAGYDSWTNLTDDSANFQVTDPSGIDVNKNTNSPFYGRVFVGSAPPLDSGLPAIFKFNADGSPADEGGWSAGNYPWGMGYFPNSGEFLYSPWKIAIADDDKVYINDWSANGIVLAFDEVISTNCLTVLNTDNYPEPGASLSGLWVTGSGTNTRIWMVDYNPSANVGIVQWTVTTNGALASNDTGTVVVAPGPNGLNEKPYDVSVDASGRIYAIQSLDGLRNTNDAGVMRVFCFPPYTGQAATDPLWRIGSPDDSLEYAYGIAVDPTASWVAVAVRGDGSGSATSTYQYGAVNIYYATNGQRLTSLYQGTNDGFTDVAWDNVGNLYVTDLTAMVWRAYSPPGTNQATTLAVPVVQVYESLIQPSLCAPIMSAGQFGFTLHGQSNVTYRIEFSSDLVNWTPIATNYDTADIRAVILPGGGDTSFYRAVAP